MAGARISSIRGRTAIVHPDDFAIRLSVMAGDTVRVRETTRGMETSGLGPADDNEMRDTQETVQRDKENWHYAGG
jgi:hypothetical protein